MYNNIKYYLFTITIISIFSAFSCSPLPNNIFNPIIKITYQSAEIQPEQTLKITSFSENPTDITFSIENAGVLDLILTEYVLTSDAFSISKKPATSIAANEKTELKIRFFSDNIENSTQVKIISNDPSRTAFAFYINCPKSNIELYFTGPAYDPTLQEALIEKINNQTSGTFLDVCFYGFDNDPVITALENAIARGVHVRFVGDLDGNGTIAQGAGNYYAGYYRIADALDQHFPVAGKKRINFPLENDFNDFTLINDSIMHNKFMIFTDDSGINYLFTGSSNCTYTDFTLNNNNAFIFQDAGIAETYREQFEFLLGLPGHNPINEIRHHVIEGITVDVLFAPSVIDGKTPMDMLIDMTETATASVEFMIFSFTHLDLIHKIIDKYNEGIKIKGTFDESQLINSSEEILVRTGIPCRKDGNYNVQEDGHGGKLHHKTMIIDDTIVITGSYNWSYSADTLNNENILIIHSKELAGIYHNEWQKRWNEGLDMKYTGNNNGEEYDYQDVIINELMWMGSRKTPDEIESRDEFIELKNLTCCEINLNGWSLEGAGSGGKILYLENCSISPYGYLTIMHKEKSDSAFQPENNNVTTSLSISNENLEIVLKAPMGNEIDRAGNGSAGEDFSGYSNINKKSMARKEIPGNGADLSNWFTTNTQMNISTDYSYLLFNLATPGADNSQGDLAHNALSLVISEIAWAGTDASATDEWFELYNNTDMDINLAGWTIEGGLDIQLYGIIPAYKHFLLERTNDDSVPDIFANMIYTGSLNNEGEVLRLVYNYREIDCVDMQSGWAAGSSSTEKISMERIDPTAPSESGNWQNGSGDTEGAQNSLE